MRLFLCLLVLGIGSSHAYILPYPYTRASHDVVAVQRQSLIVNRACRSIEGSIEGSMDSTVTKASASSSPRPLANQGRPWNLYLGTVLLAGALLAGPVRASAYDSSDYASDTVQAAIQSLEEGSGDVQATFKAFENIADIITEGKGVGGSINYKGVQLQRGYIADEDTSIYNPGLTLLTESEKERIVEAVVQSRKQGLQQNQWSTDNEYGYDFLREKLDPLHMYELKGYLSILPYYAAVVYVGVLAVQQFARDVFSTAYLVGVAAILAPILVLVSLGPR